MISKGLIIFVSVFHVLYALHCTDQSNCLVEPGTKSFAEQIIEVASNNSNSSFTIMVYGGNYSTTNGSAMNFINFRDVTIKKYDATPVNVMCPHFTTGKSYNGIGFQHSTRITISGLNFMRCGIVTAGLYFLNSTDVLISDSTFHHNTDCGIRIVFGNNISIINCYFYYNVGMQPDNFSQLIVNDPSKVRGVSIGLFFENQNTTNIWIIGCNFTNNIAYKTADYNPSNETRSYSFIPFGSGGGVYLKLSNSNNSFISISNCLFYNNTVIHQGGAIVMLPVNSINNTLDIFDSQFVGNKALGYLLRSRNDTVNRSNVNNFVDKINHEFSVMFDSQSINNLNSNEITLTGGSGGAIAVSLFGRVEHNTLRIRKSNFSNNIAFTVGGVGFNVRDILSSVENGVNSNHAFIENCDFTNNFAFVGSAIIIASYSRVDLGSRPVVIKDCTFARNNNLRSLLPLTVLYRSGIFGVVLVIRYSVNFRGRNVFLSNFGSGVNINHARVNVQGLMEFYDNHGAEFGGAVRLGELTLMQILPNTSLIFTRNTALGFGGAFAVENYRAGNDTTLVLNHLCFIQYNIGGEHEYKPENWEANFTFNNNTVKDKNGQGLAFYADDISRCVDTNANDTYEGFNQSVFSNPHAFDFSIPYSSQFETAPQALFARIDAATISLGEIFVLVMFAEDGNKNLKNALYSYSRNAISNPSNIIVIDLEPQHAVLSFASVNKVTMQNTSLVLQNTDQLQNCIFNYNNSYIFTSEFNLNLIDSSKGQVVDIATIKINISCCHTAYEYNNVTGKCMFQYIEHNDVILREDRTSKKYIYVRADRYGGFDDGGFFVTAAIPLSHHNCTQEGNLPGCIVKDDKLHEQCNQGRSGFLCGRCSTSSNQGTALSLIECVSCKPWHIAVFVAICCFIVVISFAIIYNNIGLPNPLKGFLFFIQVVAFVYKTGVKDGNLNWDFYLSRFFGFSLFFPLCISSNLETVDVAMLGFVTPLLMAACTFTYIVLARFFPKLSKRKTVDGIWFLILIAYVYTADTCLNLLRCVRVYEPIKFNGKRVYYFDGELECFKGKHLPYGVTAIIITVVALLSLPVYVLAITFNFIKKGGPLRDVISSGIEKEYHWWYGYDLFRRLLFFIVYLFCENLMNDYTQLALTTVTLLILVITSRVHPYTKKWANFAEGFILLDLVFISAYFLDYNRLSSTHNNSFVIVLLILPFIYFFLYLLIELLRKKEYLSDRFNLVSDSLIKLWNFINEEPSTTHTSPATDEDAMYVEYRDELDDFVTVED